jgi:hypothetical protein
MIDNPNNLADRGCVCREAPGCGQDAIDSCFVTLVLVKRPIEARVMDDIQAEGHR